MQLPLSLYPDPCDESVARKVLCKAEHHKSRSSELVPGQGRSPSSPFRDGVHHAGRGRGESVWGAGTAATASSGWRQVHQPAGWPGHQDRRFHHYDCRDTVICQLMHNHIASRKTHLCLLGLFLCLRSSYKPLFVRMTPLQSDWSPMGLKAIIPNLLHHTLLGYNFLIPDAVGNTRTYGSLFYHIVIFLPFCENWKKRLISVALDKAGSCQ